MSRNTPRKISKAEVRRSIDDGIEANDAIRLSGLENLLRFRSGKANAQQRELERLMEKYDEEHPRVAQLQTRLEANVSYIGGLRMEITRAKTPSVEPEPGSWCVQGHVYDRQACPIPGARVELFGVDGKKLPTVEAANTDSKGYYRLDYTPPDGISGSEQILDSSEDAILATADDAAATGAGGAPAAAADTESIRRLSGGLRINTNENAQAAVFVRASDSQDPELCADSTLITPRDGVCSYRDLSLDTIAYKPQGKDRRSTRYLGNSATRELHDLKNETTRCQIDAIRFDHCISFKTQKEAVAADYDFCAYCFGKDKSKR